jgi:hypothetical protein
MCSWREGIPADIYSQLWTLQIYRKLGKSFKTIPIKMVFLLTDSPPAFLVEIDKGNFEVKMLENVKDPKDLDRFECDAYIALPTEIFLKGPNDIRNAIAQKKAKIKNYEILTFLEKISEAL